MKLAALAKSQYIKQSFRSLMNCSFNLQTNIFRSAFKWTYPRISIRSMLKIWILILIIPVSYAYTFLSLQQWYYRIHWWKANLLAMAAMLLFWDCSTILNYLLTTAYSLRHMLCSHAFAKLKIKIYSSTLKNSS